MNTELEPTQKGEGQRFLEEGFGQKRKFKRRVVRISPKIKKTEGEKDSRDGVKRGARKINGTLPFPTWVGWE